MLDFSKILGVNSKLIPSGDETFVVLVAVSDVNSVAKNMAESVVSQSWMMGLDHRSRRAYEYTYNETAKILENIFKENDHSNIGIEFGELLVSICSAKGLEDTLEHIALPIAELWKPKRKGNEGFDFHTVANDVLNFGEAKFSIKDNPYDKAIRQIRDFIEQEKHLRDCVHLDNFVPESTAENLDNDVFGVVAAFSINGNESNVVKNALTLAGKNIPEICNSIFLVGVVNEDK